MQKNNLKIDYYWMNLRLPFITVTIGLHSIVEARVEQVWVIILSVVSFRLKMSLGKLPTSIYVVILVIDNVSTDTKVSNIFAFVEIKHHLCIFY